MANRVGVDVGGTFTDLIYYDDETGEIRVAKEPTTPASPDVGVRNALLAGIPRSALEQLEYFLHGTTVGLNALLTRTGAVVGLITTGGFRDILELRRGDRGDPYDLFWRPSEPLVARRRRAAVTERILATGEVATPLDRSEVRDALAAFRQHGVTSIAVAFINAYANPVHELQTRELLVAEGFDPGAISLSHEISGEYREYERTSTAVVDAYVRPRMTQYLDRLGDGLHDLGFRGQRLLMRCGGGSMTFREAAMRPVETIMSGPVGGAEGAAELARELSLDRVVTADVGGTSFDTCLITRGQPQLMYQGSIIDMPIQAPWIDVRSIGAGGGSIAWVDVGGMLRVGPESAGAEPGPVSYGRGGTQPTVTDAAAILGMLGNGELASGLRLDFAGARSAFTPLADRLGFSVEETARGVMTLAGAAMANAVRELTVEQGQDPRKAVLMPFGGAGALFGTLLAQNLDIGSIVVPPYAGNFSAWGLLGADVKRSAARTQISALNGESLAQAGELVTGLLRSLEARGDGDLSRTAVREVIREAALDMRYAGQEYSLTVAIDECTEGQIHEGPEAIRERFEADYARTFGHTMDEDIEIVSVRASIRIALPRRRARPARAVTGTGEARSVKAFSFTTDEWATFPIVDRAEITAEPVHGPAIVVEETTTTYLDAGFSAALGQAETLQITPTGAVPAGSR